MSATALSREQSEAMGRVLAKLYSECDAKAVVLCDIGGNILGSESKAEDSFIETVSALAAGAFAATRELADTIGEPRFKSIAHRGEKSGILIQALLDEFLIVVVLGGASTEGLIRLYLKKVTRQLESILAQIQGQTAQDAGATGPFEVRENTESPADETV